MIHHRLRGSNKGVSARYWRVIANDVTWNATYPYSLQFYTISFFSSSNASGTDLCLGKTSAASTYFPWSPDSTYIYSNANDNNAGSFWATRNDQTTYQWWSVDLVSDAEVHSVVLVPNADLFFKRFNLQRSSDNTNWTTVATRSTTSSGTQTFTGL